MQIKGLPTEYTSKQNCKQQANKLQFADALKAEDVHLQTISNKPNGQALPPHRQKHIGDRNENYYFNISQI